MIDLLETLQRFYNGDVSTIYEKAKCRTWVDGDVGTTDVVSKECNGVTFTWIDKISNRLACVQAEYDKDGHHREMIGLIAAAGTWKVICVLKSVAEFRFHELYDDCFQQTEDLRAISIVLLQYCHDVYLMDAEDCMQYFWNETRMYHPDAGETFTDVEIQILFQRWKNQPDPVAIGIKEYSRIHYVVMLDTNTAMAKIGCARLDHYFDDYLYLMRIHDEWKIVNKMTQELHSGEKI